MRTEMAMADEKDTPIVARCLFDYGSENHAGLTFRQGEAEIMLALPARMHSCLETIARVFNECMDAKPDERVLTRTDGPVGGEFPSLAGGQYIGLTRELVSESSGPWVDFTPVGGITKGGFVRGEDADGHLVWHTGGVLIVTAEVAMQATKCGWELAPEHPTSGDLVAIKR